SDGHAARYQSADIAGVVARCRSTSTLPPGAVSGFFEARRISLDSRRYRSCPPGRKCQPPGATPAAFQVHLLFPKSMKLLHNQTRQRTRRVICKMDTGEQAP